ncbi:hypothetical protein GTQ40_10240 [Flavobacteriaceae bacterium R38]|nr:hypothetical protein [Flavobacteriaceae bacterium R38]
MKKLLMVSLAFILAIGLNSCSDDESLDFTLQPDPEGLIFTNSFAANYLLSNATAANIAERFVWTPLDFGVPTEVRYELQGSTDNSVFNAISNTTDNNIAVTVRNLLDLAETLGLDADPSTNDAQGNPNNVGTVYLRVRAFTGNDGANTVESFSETVAFNVELVETGLACNPVELSTFGIIFFNGNSDPDTPLYTNEDGIHFAAINLPGALGKFRENMDFAVNFGLGDGGEFTLTMGGFGNDIPFGSGGSTGIALVTADFNNLTYTIDTNADSWGMVGNTINDFGGSGPDIRLTEDPCNPGVWFAFNVTIGADGVFKFRLNDDFASNFGTRDGGGPGELMMGGFGNDIPITAGTYNVTLDLRVQGEETYVLELQ